MIARGLGRMFVVVYVLILLSTAATLFLEEPAHAPRYWGFIYLAVALIPLAAWPWIRRQLMEYPITSTAFGLLSLVLWSKDARYGRVEDALILIPILFAVAWAIRGFTKKETQDGSV